MSNCSHPLSESAMFCDKKVQGALIQSFFYVLPRVFILLQWFS